MPNTGYREGKNWLPKKGVESISSDEDNLIQSKQNLINSHGKKTTIEVSSILTNKTLLNNPKNRGRIRPLWKTLSWVTYTSKSA